MNKELFVKRLKDCIVERYADNEAKQKYFQNKKVKNEVNFPKGIKGKFADDIESKTTLKGETVNAWLNPNKTNLPDCETLSFICSLLNISSDYLLGLSDKKETYEDIFISETLKISPNAVLKLKQYDKNIMLLLDGLICSKDTKTDFDCIHNLLCAIYRYGMTCGSAKITIENALFDEKEVVDDKIEADSLLKSSASRLLDLCLTSSVNILHNVKLQAYDNKIQIAKLEASILKKQTK